MTENLSVKQKAEFRDIFRFFDINNDGKISALELGSLFRNMGHDFTEIEIKDMINEVDLDGNGTIDFDEFLNLMVRKMKETDEEQEIIEAFKQINQSGTGLIDYKELMIVFENMDESLTADEAKDMIAQADLNKDGKIDFNDLMRMMMGR